jgi:hypothetical protein
MSRDILDIKDDESVYDDLDVAQTASPNSKSKLETSAAPAGLDLAMDVPIDLAGSVSPPLPPPPEDSTTQDLGSVATTALSSTQSWRVLLAFGVWGRVFELLCEPCVPGAEGRPLEVTLPQEVGVADTSGLLIPAALRIARAVFLTPDPTVPQVQACADARVMAGRRVVLVVGRSELWKGLTREYSMRSRIVLPPARSGPEDPADLKVRQVLKALMARMSVDFTWLRQHSKEVKVVGAAALGLLYFGYRMMMRSRDAKKPAVTKGVDTPVLDPVKLIS